MFLKNYSYIIYSLLKLLIKEIQHKLKEKKIEAFKLIKILVLSNKIRTYYLLYRETYIKINISDRVITNVLIQK